MSCAAITVGAACIGWLVPEFVFMLSPHPDGFGRVAVGVNLLSLAGFALIAFGVSS